MRNVERHRRGFALFLAVLAVAAARPAFGAGKIEMFLPLNRDAYQTNETIPLAVVRTAGEAAVRAKRRFYTFMHAPTYRLSVAWQNVAYNQPTQPQFYMGAGMPTPPRPKIVFVGKQGPGLEGDLDLVGAGGEDSAGHAFGGRVGWSSARSYPGNPG